MEKPGTGWPSHEPQDVSFALAPAIQRASSVYPSESVAKRTKDIKKSLPRFRILGMPIAAIAFLILIAGSSFLRSHYQLLWTDEFCALETDSVSSIAQLIHNQTKTPISLDPLVYNAFAHGAIALFGDGPFAIRLPSIVGYLLMEVCLFYFVRRIATERAAIFALAFPALVGTVSYSVQARPYGLLLGLSALAMVSWQTVARRETKRILALLVLSLSLVLVINTHYYGVLLLIPICSAELFRSFERKRLDLPVIFSIVGAGVLGTLILLPFAKGVSQFRAHYFEHGVSYHFISHTYIWMITGYFGLSVPMQHILGIAFALVFAALIVSFIRLQPGIHISFPKSEAVFLCTLAALPFFGFLLARSVTKVIESRYVLPAIIGMAAWLAILAAPLLRKKIIGRVILVLLFLAIAGSGVWHIQAERDQAREYRASLQLNSSTRAGLDATSDQPIYVTNPAVFQGVGYYSPNADIRSRLTLTYSREAEMRSTHIDHLALSAANMRTDGVPNVRPLEPLTAHGSEHLFLLYHNPPDWTGQALADAHAKITLLGPAYGGDLVLVSFP